MSLPALYSRSFKLSAAAAMGLMACNAHADWTATATHALPIPDSAVTSALPDGTPMHVEVALQLRNVDALKTTLKNLYTPGNPQYGRYLTTAQFTAAYGPTSDQVKSVTDYLTQMGFTNLHVTPNNGMVSADATAAAVSQAFNTHFIQFQQNGKSVYMPAADLMAPSSLNGVVLGVQGVRTAYPMQVHSHRLLQDYIPGSPTAAAVRAPLKSAVKSAKSGDSPAAFDPTNVFLNQTFLPAAFIKAYDAITAPDGSGTIVAISTGGTDLSGPQADFRAFERFTGQPYIPLTQIDTAPTANPQVPDNDGEWDLDLQYSTGIAGNVKGVILYNGSGIGDLGTLQAFANDNIAKLLNMSYGGCESVAEAAGENTTDDQVFMQMVSQGQTAFASSGDAGAACSVGENLGTPDSGPTDVEYPGSSTYVVSVGGSSLFTDAEYNYNGEIAWPSGGGGTSEFEASSADQAKAGVETTSSAPTNLRAVPDVSMNAGFNAGPAAGFYETADVIDSGYHVYTVGTSLSSPLSMGTWARFQSARCGELGFAIPYIYALDTAGGLMSTATGFNDVTIGTNGVYTAGTGFDYTNGFGTYDIAAVNAALPPVTSDCKPDTAPTALLTADTISGPAPLTVNFSGAKSSDPDANDSLAYYVLDYGDQNAVDILPTPTFLPHTYAKPGLYNATFTVRDSHGVVSKQVTQLISVAGMPDACTLPGLQIMTSPSGVNTGEEGQDTGMGIDDLLSVSVAEPADMANKIVFTIKVANLTTVLPDFRWLVYFRLPDGSLRDTDLYYVGMVSSDGASPTFEYGIKTIVPGASVATYNSLGSLDAASNYTADGTITLVLDKSATGLGTSGIHTGDVLTYLESVTRLSTPSTGAGTTQDYTGDLLPYQVIGNDLCSTGVAVVQPTSPTSPTSPTTPVTVTTTSTAATGGASSMDLMLLPLLGLGAALRRRRRG